MYRILIVDDYRDAAQALATLLTYLGHQVQIADSGVQALRLAQQIAPSMVFLELRLSGSMDGYETARRLREMQGGGVRLVAYTTAKCDPTHLHAAGIDTYVLKGTEMANFTALLDTLFVYYQIVSGPEKLPVRAVH